MDATALCSAFGAQAPTWPSNPLIGPATSAGATIQPTRTPVAANALEIPSTYTVYGATSGQTPIGCTCFVSPNVSVQYTCCLLYTSDAADDLLCVDLGGR